MVAESLTIPTICAERGGSIRTARRIRNSAPSLDALKPRTLGLEWVLDSQRLNPLAVLKIFAV